MRIASNARLACGAVCFTLLLWPSRVDACSCAPPANSCQDARTADLIFVGTVTIPGKTIVDRLWAGVRDHFSPGGYGRREIRLSVAETLNGSHLPTRDVWSNWGNGGDCGPSFDQGTRYLVYANYDPKTDRYLTSVCDGTRILDQKPDAGLDFLRALRRGATKARLRGAVTADLQESQRRLYHLFPEAIEHPVPGVQLRLQSVRETKVATTDSAGIFDFPILQGGSYVLSSSAGSSRFPGLPMKLQVDRCTTTLVLAQPKSP